MEEKKQGPLLNEPLKAPALCSNCNRQVELLYCSNCGQSVRDVRVSLKILAKDFLDGYLTLDSKLFRSLKPLAFKPGRLTLEFMEGRRIRYLSPLRIYLFFSVLFFLSLGLSNSIENKRLRGLPHRVQTIFTEADIPSEIKNELGKRAKELYEEGKARAAAKKWGLDFGGVKPDTDSKEEKTASDQAHPTPVESGRAVPSTLVRDSSKATASPGISSPPSDPTALQAVLEQNPRFIALKKSDPQRAQGIREAVAKAEARIDFEVRKKNKNRHARFNSGHFDEDNKWGQWFNEALERQEQHLNELDGETMSKLLSEKVMANIPKGLFFLMPFFALFLKLCYIRQDPLYIDHLIFAFHFHAYLFGLLTFLVWGNHFLNQNSGLFTALTILIILFAPPIYLFFSLKRVYRQDWLKTGIKFSIISGLYVSSLIILSIVILAVSVFSI